MSATDELEASPLEQLAGASGRDFPNLLRARDVTRNGLQKRRETLARLPHDDNAAVVLMGSWGRAEVTAESDDDFMVLVRGTDFGVQFPPRTRIEARDSSGQPIVG